MNRLVIVGNGFDLAHDLKTSYKDFIYWYLNDFFSCYMESKEPIVTNGLLSITSSSMVNSARSRVPVLIGAEEIYYYSQKTDVNPVELLGKLKELEGLDIKLSPLLETILISFETKGWTDIESDYYMLLKKYYDNPQKCEELNAHVDCLRAKLTEYLQTQNNATPINGLMDRLKEDIKKDDVSIASQKDFCLEENKCKKIMLLDFNYTHTTDKYSEAFGDICVDSVVINHIHCTLEFPNDMIFGYGDEMDKDFKSLEDRNDNELLKNMKSVKYLETSNYRNMLSFIESDLFQVYIMGHSCGNSDRTLLNTIFEHPNCISIKPFYFIDEKGRDNYSELTQNIYRNFKDKTLFRDRVVNKEQCTTMEKEKSNYYCQ